MPADNRRPTVALGALDDGCALTPPMGWNSWNRFGRAIDERIVAATAEAMIGGGLRAAGYEYVVIDDGWQAETRDEAGELVPNAKAFPSGIAALADAVHRLGLRFGIYTDAGTRTCVGLPGSLGYEFRDARRFAAWGVDYLKVDWCHTDGLGAQTLYRKWSYALRRVERPIVLSICEWGRSRPWRWAGTVGHLWRTCWDIQDRWDSLLAILDRQADLAPYAGPGHWNDPDMLEVGNGGMTETEYRSHFSLWAMLAAPLMAGNDVRDMPSAVRDILTAPEVIAVDQDPAGRQAVRVRSGAPAEIWVKPLVGKDRRAVLLFNRGPEPGEIAVAWSELGLAAGGARVRDLWARRDLGFLDGGFRGQVAPHGVALLGVEGSGR